jgi:hypothetical protein
MGYREVVLQDRPVSFWRMEENVGTFRDVMTKNDLTSITGTFTGRGLPGPFNGDGRSALLDGSSAVASTSSGTALPTGGSSRTIEAWIKPNFDPTVNGQGGAIASYWGGSTQICGFQLFNSSSTILVFSDGVNTNNNVSVTAAQCPAKGVWGYLVLTMTSTQLQYYFNGVLVKTFSFGATLNTTGTSTIKVGNRVDTNVFWPGNLKDVSVYSGQLSAARIREHYLAGIGEVGRLPRTDLRIP